MIYSVMTVNQYLLDATRKLEQAGVGTARLDALVLLEDITGHDRSHLLANPDIQISTAQDAKLTKLLSRRAKHIPLAYIRGTTEFYGKNFVITPAVLEPRPESETMIELLTTLPNLPQNARLADVGTGSGALGIIAKLNHPNWSVELLEIDENALKIAQMNVDKYTMDTSVIRSDLLSESKQDNDVLLCNLPYVPDGYQINTAASHEPSIAIFGGPDGLAVYRKLFEQLRGVAKRPLYLLFESLPPQHAAL
ncbi:peptide chain release factor N(5)-glutamine methyltransferase, partial [Candidatus Dojkabacteria bacterium]|nr:peptide chain release factor N(5)-glutamine methyltransferase [Candidatus Dojkabacteria bacterium]